MIRVSVMYPKGDEVSFDHDYYRERHLPLAEEHFAGLVRTEADVAVDGPYVAVGHLYFDSLGAMAAAMGGPSAGEVLADLANFTNAQPVIQVSEIAD